MKKHYIYTEDWESYHGTHMTRRDALRKARKEAPWASVMIKSCGTYVCFESWTDAVTFVGQGSKRSRDEIYESIRRFATGF